MNNNPANPIGIFDSGLGGLTVTRAVAQLLPNENIIYFGDTAHVPWGEKSTAAIQAYSIKICEMLLQQNCKLILIACNTGSTAAYDLLREYVGDKVKLLDVIDPVMQRLCSHYPQKKLGLIGTRQTVNSNVYKKKIDELGVGIQLNAVATPLLVPIIEEGFSGKAIAVEAIKEYLCHPELQDIDALILACTHYPLIKSHVQDFYQNKVDIIDSSEFTAQTVKEWLEENKLTNQAKKTQMHFYVSDYTPTFAAHTKLFFGEEVPLERYPIWD